MASRWNQSGASTQTPGRNEIWTFVVNKKAVKNHCQIVCIKNKCCKNISHIKIANLSIHFLKLHRKSSKMHFKMRCDTYKNVHCKCRVTCKKYLKKQLKKRRNVTLELSNCLQWLFTSFIRDRKSAGQIAGSDPSLRLHLFFDPPCGIWSSFDLAIKGDQKGGSDPDRSCVYTSRWSPFDRPCGIWSSFDRPCGIKCKRGVPAFLACLQGVLLTRKDLLWKGWKIAII